MPFTPRAQAKAINIIHAISFILIQGVMGIALYRAFGIKPRGLGQSRWALSISAKSMIILTYQVVSEHVRFFHRLYSLKAFMVLNVLEVAFWIAAIVLTVMSMVKSCSGITCTLNGVIIGLAAVLAIIDVPVALITIKQWLFVRKHGYHPYEGHWSRAGEVNASDKSIELAPAGSKSDDARVAVHVLV